MTRALELRERLVARLQEGETKPTVTDLLTKVVRRRAHAPPRRERALRGRRDPPLPDAHVGIAVAAPNGLVVPVIRDAERRTIPEIAAARADIVGRARDGKLQQADLEGGTFTISNLGMFGIEQFVAVLNPPQAAILAVGATEERPVVRDGEVVVRPLMSMTLTCDHRAIDGADGAEFLRTVKELLEEPRASRCELMATRLVPRPRDLDAGPARFYRDTLGFDDEEFVDSTDDGWSRLERGGMEIALAEGEPDEDGGVAHVDVEDVKREAERLREAGVEVGVVFELHGQIRLLDVFDPDGNRIQLAQSLDP